MDIILVKPSMLQNCLHEPTLLIIRLDPSVEINVYHRLVSSLVYLIVTCPDISNAVHVVSQLMDAPCLCHYAVVLCILP